MSREIAISALPTKSTEPGDTDIIVIVADGVTYKIAWSVFMGSVVDTLTNGTARFGGANPTTIYTDQQTVTATATALTSQALINGVVITAATTNAGNVFVGGSGVTTTDTGSGSGYKLQPGQSISFGVTNCSAIYIIGTAADIVYVAGN